MTRSKHLILFHVGPVREFIATARTGQDLWFGSWLLSEMAKAVALEVVRWNEGDASCLVFPSASIPELESPDFNAPNRVLAVTSGPPAELASRAKQSMLDLLDRVCREAFADLSSVLQQETAMRQVVDSFEFFWASVPLEGDYPRRRALVDSLLAARKMTRDFTAVSWGSKEFKCSLDGIRESVIAREQLDQLGRGLGRMVRLRRGERLCGLCAVKRFGRRGSRTQFLSTSHVAALPLLARIGEKHRPSVERYIERLGELGADLEPLRTVRRPHPVFDSYDGEILFEERLDDLFEAKTAAVQAKAALRELLKVLGVRRPLPYYAVLQADGDYMGQLVDSQENPESHRSLSRAQSEFAREVREVVEDHHGSLIYSGGDDVLALLPLHTMLACAQRLSERFRQKLGGFRAWPEGTFGASVSPSLSVGVVVAHHLEPLSDVLRAAEETLRKAKSVPGKGGLAVSLKKRGGEPRTVTGRLDELAGDLACLVELHRQDAVPDGAAYELRELVNRLTTKDAALASTLNEVACAEAKRILARKRAKKGTEPVSRETLKVLEHWFSCDETRLGALSRLADGLVVSGLLAGAAEMACLAPTTV